MNDHVINALISLAFFTMAGLLLWLLVRMNARERGRRVRTGGACPRGLGPFLAAPPSMPVP